LPRIITTRALCLATLRQRESSKLVTLFSEDSGRVVVSARGARRPKSRFGAALERFAESRVTFYWHENRTVFTASDAELIRSYSGLADLPARFLAAEQVVEFLLRTVQPHDPVHHGPAEAIGRIFRLTTAYLAALETAEAGFRAVVASYLLKSASFLGYRPDFSRCATCRRALGTQATEFVPERGGLVCPRCSGGSISGTPGIPLSHEERRSLLRLLSTPVSELASLSSEPAGVSSALRRSAFAARTPPTADPLRLALLYASCHIDRLILNSYNWDTL